MNKDYDVVILGGGLAGLTLSLQLKQSKPDISILVLEKRKANAANAAHKVGESTVELGTYYLREVLDLKDYMDKFQLPKHGLRFFFSPKHKENIEERVELGPREFLPVPSHQIDRGVFENDLVDISRENGNEVFLNARVKTVDFGDTSHEVSFSHNGADEKITCRWVVDATGRNAFLKRKLNFTQDISHDVNAVWFRLNTKIDIEDWSDDKEWLGKVKPGLRYLSTVHLMDKGYWVWIIPLVTGCTSIGIVADPAFHPFDKISRFDKAMEWLAEHEPQCHKMLEVHKDKLLDFKFLKHYAHGCGQVYSENRWGVTGEAGFFLDPLYSPGTDFIAINNSWLNDLIIRDLSGESIGLHVKVYEETHRSLFQNWLPLYTHQYALMGHTQVMVIKIFWDWAIYWSVTALIFSNKGFTNIGLLKKLASKPGTVLRRFEELNTRMQKLFQDWIPYDTADITHKYIDPFDIEYLKAFHKDIETQYDTRALLGKLEHNMTTLEKIASEVFRLVSAQVHGTSRDLKLDPYTFSLENNEQLESINSVFHEPDPEIAADVATMWFYEKSTLRV
ncbi:MAG: FAD-dependent monooxygenase [Chitinophagales bacterium]